MTFTIANAIDNDGDTFVYLGRDETTNEYEILDTTLDIAPGRFIALRSGDQAVGDGLDPNFTIIQAQQKDGAAGYTILLTDGTTYLTGDVDELGNVSLDPFSPIDVLRAEDLFGVNLNGDNIIGETITITPTDDGGTDGFMVGEGDLSGDYYVVALSAVTDGTASSSSADAIPVTDANGPVNVAELAGFGFELIQAKAGQTAGTYEILWQSDAKFVIWTLDADGEFVVGGRSEVPVTDTDAVAALQGQFNFLFPVDPGETITVTNTDDGGTDGFMVATGNDSGDYYVVALSAVTDGTASAADAIPVSDANGPVNAAEFAGFGVELIQAKAGQTAGTYEILWQSDAKFVIWTLDADGEFVVGSRSEVPVTDTDAVAALQGQFNFLLPVDPVDPGETITVTNTDDGGTDGFMVATGNDSGDYYVVALSAVTDGTASAADAIPVSDANGPVNAAEFAGFGVELIQAKAGQTAGTYEILWQSDAKFVIWTLDADGEFVVGSRSEVPVTDTDAVAALQGQFNFLLPVDPVDPGETITVTNTDDGGTDGFMVATGNDSGDYYVVALSAVTDGTASAADAIPVSDANGPVNAAEFAGFGVELIQAKAGQTAGTYEILWQSDAKFVIWTLDADGEFVVGSRSEVPVTDTDAVAALQGQFNFLLPVDPGETITVTNTDDGGTDGFMVATGNDSGDYYVVALSAVTDGTASAADAIPVSDANGPVNAAEFAGFGVELIQAKAGQTAGTYEILWQSDAKFVIWTLDADGEFVVGSRSEVPVTDTDAVAALQGQFNFLLPVDPVDPGETITVTNTDDGGTDGFMVATGNDSGDYYVVALSAVTDGTASAADAIPVSDANGPVNAAEFAGFGVELIQAKAGQTAGTYEILWQSDAKFVIWTLDADGEFVVGSRSEVPVTDTDAVAALQGQFNFLLPVDPVDPGETITVTNTDDGGTDGFMVATGNDSGDYYVVALSAVTDGTASAADAIPVSDANGPVNAAEFAGFGVELIQAKAGQTAGTYEILWQSDAKFVIWTLDADGEFVVGSRSEVPVTDTDAVAALQGQFNFLLPVDPVDPGETITVTNTDDGGTDGFMVATGNDSGDYYVVALSAVTDGTASAADAIPVSDANGPVNAAEFAGFGVELIQAKAGQTAGTYEILWQNPDAGKFVIWTLDADGEFVVGSRSEVLVTDPTAVAALQGQFNFVFSGETEAQFGADLNDDSFVFIEDNGVTELASEADTGQYFVNGVALSTLVGDVALNTNDVNIIQAEQVEVSGEPDVFLLLVEDLGNYFVGEANLAGQFDADALLSSISLSQAEVDFQVDLDGDTFLG